MNAYEKALAAIAKVIAKARPLPPPLPRHKPAKRKAAPEKRPASKKARVVSRKRRHRKPAAYNPPRSEPDVAELVESFAPAAALTQVGGCFVHAAGVILPDGELLDDQEPGPISAPLYVPPRLEPAQPAPASTPGDWVDGRVTERPSRAASVKAAPAPPSATPASPTARAARGSCKAVDAKTGRSCKLPAHAGPNHAHERGPFHLVAAPGQHIARAVDLAAWGQPQDL